MSATTRVTVFFRTTCAIVAITLLLFIAINTGAQLYLEHHPLSVIEAHYFLDEDSSDGTAIRKRIFNTHDERLLEAYLDVPGIRPHTVLHFTGGTARPHYKVGLEGIRYLPDSLWHTAFQYHI